MKIFIIHKWRHLYVKYVLEELLKNNNSKDIILLTDDKKQSKEYFWYDITYENIDDYSKSSNEFENIYVHKSKNPFNYELICLQRWLIILEYMGKNDIDSCRQVDSDVLVFCNLNQYANKYLKWYDFCCVGISWWMFYWNRKWLNEFKKFLFDTYKNNLDKLESYYKEEWACIYNRNNWYVDHEKTWCVSDMTLFYLFIYGWLNWVKYKDIWMINKNTVFDDNINRWVWFKYSKYLKSLKLIGDNYYWTLIWKNNQKIFFNCIHFAWDAKSVMEFYAKRNLWLKYILVLYYTKFFVPIIVKISEKLWIKNYLMEIYHRLKSIIYKQSMPLR